MKNKVSNFLLALTGSLLLISCSNTLPQGFCYLTDVVPQAQIEARYATANNFMGRKVDGYQSKELIVTRRAAHALGQVHRALAQKGLGLKVFDAYRPQRAVNHFMRWCADEADTVNKQTYYPNIAKKELVPLGYIAEKSGHSRGSTVDLTLIDLTTGDELDMGTPWDYFGPESHVDYANLTSTQKANRQLLQDVMIAHGFKPLPEEWWHFTLENEPFPDTYFDFVVE